MRKTCIGFAASLLLWAATAPAQVTVEVALEQDQFLPGESVPIAVRITNRSGRVLELGETDDWLTFSLNCKEVSGGIVPQTDNIPVKGAFTLPSSKRAIKRLDIAPYFAITTPGKYQLSATIHVAGWENDITSGPTSFFVIEGTRLWEQEVGLPGAGTNSAPDVRRYRLQESTNFKGLPKLYLRVTDAAGLKIFKLTQIGVMLSFSHPEPQIDAQSNLHVMWQNAPSSFGYSVYTPDGELIRKETWDYLGDSRPRLRSDDSGRIGVIGGVRRPTRDDIPPWVEPDNMAPAAPLTNSPADAKLTNSPAKKK